MLSAHKNKFIEYNKERYTSSLVLKCQVSVSPFYYYAMYKLLMFSKLCVREAPKYSVCIVGHIF